MKKVLVAGAALLVAGALATTASAEVNIGGDARARIKYKNAYNFGNSVNPQGDLEKKDTLQFDSRVRFQFRGVSAGGAYAVGRLRLQDTNWNGPEKASDTNNIWVDKAYIGIPMGDSLTMEAGYNQLTINKFSYDDIDVAGVQLKYKADGATVVGFFNMDRDGQSSDNPTDVFDDNNAMTFGVLAMFTPNDDWKVGADVAWAGDSAAGYTMDDGTVVAGGEDGWWGSVFANGNIAGFGLEGEFGWRSSEVQGSKDDGYGGYVQGGYTMDALNFALNVGFTKDGYVPDGDFGYYMFGGGQAITVVSIGDGGGDYQWVGGTVGFAVSESLKLVGNVVYANIDGPDDVGVSDKRLAKVWEISGGMNYVITEGADFDLKAGYLSPDFDGRLDGVGINDDAAFGVVGAFNVSF